MHYNCLIVDDEKELAESSAEYFNLFDVKTSFVLRYNECIEFLAENTVDFLLLDINLADQSGFELCKQIRKKYDMPILFISARQSDEDILVALGVGGDDYIKKPYTLSILLAKVKALLKRIEKDTKKTTLAENENSAYLEVNYYLHKVFLEGKELKLKGMEYALLVYLIENKGRIILKSELFEKVWRDSFTGDGTLNVHIRHLREKIEVNPNEPQHIKTIWGRGYSYED